MSIDDPYIPDRRWSNNIISGFSLQFFDGRFKHDVGINKTESIIREMCFVHRGQTVSGDLTSVKKNGTRMN